MIEQLSPLKRELAEIEPIICAAEQALASESTTKEGNEETVLTERACT